jgi:hypothetical protein
MKRGSQIALWGIVLLISSIMTLGAFIEYFENTLMEYDWWSIYLESNQSMTRGFDYDETEAYFYVDYNFRGNPLKIVVFDSENQVVFEQTTKNYLVDKEFLAFPGYYILEITNIGGDPVEIFDIGYQKPPLELDENGNFLLPSESWYQNLFSLLTLFGFIMIIVGVVIYWKDKRKIQKNQ